VPTPTDLLDRLLHQKVELHLKDQRVIAGVLLGSDPHLNLLLDEAEERTAERTRRLGRVVVRGSTVVSLDAPAVAAKAH
jgi:small nuclear ribonucleoprotein